MKGKIIYIAISNLANSPLPNIEPEQVDIVNELKFIADKFQLRFIVRRLNSPNEILQDLMKWENQILIYHYAGHGSYRGLNIKDKYLRIATLLEALSNTQGDCLRFAFINGCYSEVSRYKESDCELSATYIATSSRISDQLARDFAVNFYRLLSQGKSIRESFTEAKNEKSFSYHYEVSESETNRHLNDNIFQPPNVSTKDWGLFFDDPIQIFYRFKLLKELFSGLFLRIAFPMMVMIFFKCYSENNSPNIYLGGIGHDKRPVRNGLDFDKMVASRRIDSRWVIGDEESEVELWD